MSNKSPSFTDIVELRRRARKHLENGAVTSSYDGDVAQAVALLNSALATEIVCMLRYQYHAIMASGIHSESAKREFAQHAIEEQQHASRLAERINQLGGKPNMNPDGLLARSHSEYVECESLADMLRENLVAERIAIDSYREMIEFFREHDSTTRRLLEEILEKEEEHASDMHDLLGGGG